MAPQTLSFASLKSSIKSKKLAPVYLLHGEEGYFIDQLVKEFDNALSPDEKEFNYYILYAPQVDMEGVVDACQRLPMMADRQIVVLKEAQSITADKLDKLIPYCSSPSASTTLVISSRGEAVRSKKLLDAVNKHGGVVFESKKIYEDKLAPYISNYISERGLNIEPKALEMLRESIGSDLSRLYKEIDKLVDILGPGAMITDEAVERHIGVSKSFNTFELIDALAERDAKKVYQIADYFKANPKSTPLVMAITNIFGYFSDLMVTYFEKDRSERALMNVLGLRYPVQFKRYAIGMKNYNAFQVIEIIRAIRQFAVQSKGIGSRQNEHALFRDMLFHILTAPGEIKL
jgi:DNA polymerase-3 subunit delta